MRLITYLILALLFGAAHAAAAELSGRVVGIADGDTITVLDSAKSQHRIRLAGIDAPESKQPFGSKSKQNLSALVFNKAVTVEWEKRDRYGRIIGKVLYVPTSCATPACIDKTDANYQQVAAGMAWHYKQYEREQSPEDRQRYTAAENQAREEKRGLWADAEAVAPWEWRKTTGR